VRGLAVSLCLLLSIAACAPPASIRVEDPWARATAGSTAQVAVFMTISSRKGDRLIGASTPLASRTDLMKMEAGQAGMAMSYVETIEIRAGEPVRLDPRGLHVWLAGVGPPLIAGQTFPLTLSFEKAGDVRVDVAVLGPLEPSPG